MKICCIAFIFLYEARLVKQEFSVKQNNKLLNQRLERLRRERGLTAKAMAKLVGVAESTYREWEYGRGLKLPPFQKFSQVLAISVTEIMTGQKPDWEELVEELEVIEKRINELKLK